ncbi:MAG: hypothetical protein GY842_15885 [bacterium]|nr:hypothetical protein [bacterium]
MHRPPLLGLPNDQPRRNRAAHRSAMLVGWLVLSLAVPCSAAIDGEIVQVGFNARGAGIGGRRVVRVGAWTPVRVRLTLQGQAQFAGRLRVAQRDRDGDVCYDYAEVLLNADSRPTQEYTLYTLPTVGPDGGVDVKVELLDPNGAVVRMVSRGQLVPLIRPAAPPDALPDDDYLILDISEGQMGRVAKLAVPGKTFQPLRPISVAHITPEEIPDRWQGLEAIDCIVWDDADPDSITNNREAKLHALAEWVRSGGPLVMATARHAAAVQKTDAIGPLLPVKVGGLTTLGEAARFRRTWLGLPLEDTSYAPPIALARCSVRTGTGTRKIFPVPGSEELSPNLDTLIARGHAGRGIIVFLAASFADLLASEADATKLFACTLEIRGTTREVFPERALHQPLEGKIGFKALTGIYMVFAMLFVMAYVGLATFGSWGFLKARGWERHNWSLFAAVALVVSVVSIVAAQTVRGVGRHLHQLTVVDAVAGVPEASAIAYFGLKTGTHSVLDLWLAENYAQRPEPHPTSCFLRPLPEGKEQGSGRSGYADPGRYDLRPATAELIGVPIRATLKQLQGRWRGALRGGIAASVGMTRRSFNRAEGDDRLVTEPCFSSGSRITNNLGVDLENCFILQPTSNRYVNGTVDVRRAGNIMVHRLPGDGAVLRDGTTIDLGSLYQDPSGVQLTWNVWHRSLLDYHNAWGKSIRGSIGVGRRGGQRIDNSSESYQEALLMATTLSEYDEDRTELTDFSQQPLVFSRSRCRDLDLSDLLSGDTVLLIGFARGPGPVSFCARRSDPDREYRRIEPDEAWTVYRIVIPVANAS